MTKKTFSLKASEVNHTWVLVDASDAPLGRLSTVIAQRLTGKYKPTFTPHMDDGDYVVVINADKLIVTGDKEQAKTYYRHTGYPGGIKAQTLAEARSKDSTKLIEAAVKGMLPRNKLLAERMKRLRVFPTEEHGHAAQKPVKLEVK
ncbi:MAG TPA: 50S ribosomal protein L13 [Candidatus Saccharimonadales bacterium]|nr:50S ribosomal protein L13 [Candidatus Saccharimonadales bacterium]